MSASADTRATSGWRRFTAGFARLLDWLLIATVMILIVPVSMQIFSRYTDLIPPYIWTEELARFLFIWMIMLGAMIGVREGSHFDVDIWPRLGAKADAVLKMIANLCTLVFALVFVWSGYEFTAFSIYRISELAELPLWVIHMAWPLTGIAWIVFLGEKFVDNLRILSSRQP
ncbi:MAG: TRAP transporter small permease [Lautropia sp.]|nr:TRAP transporter small permease [Lautropia sp.]